MVNTISLNSIKEDSIMLRNQLKDTDCHFIKTQLGKFMKCEISKSLFEETKTILDINDPTKVVLASYLLNRWVSCNINNENYYMKHCKSPKRNVLYQIILNGEETDGIYEFQFKGIKIELSKDKNLLKIKSTGNYELAQFKDDKNQYYCISRDTENFKERLLNTGFITEAEYDIYTDEKSNLLLKNNLPKIIL